MDVLCVVALLLSAVAARSDPRQWQQENFEFPPFGEPQQDPDRPDFMPGENGGGYPPTWSQSEEAYGPSGPYWQGYPPIWPGEMRFPGNGGPQPPMGEGPGTGGPQRPMGGGGGPQRPMAGGGRPQRPMGGGDRPQRPMGGGDRPQRPMGGGGGPQRPMGGGRPQRPMGGGGGPQWPMGGGGSPQRPMGGGPGNGGPQWPMGGGGGPQWPMGGGDDPQWPMGGEGGPQWPMGGTGAANRQPGGRRGPPRGGRPNMRDPNGRFPPPPQGGNGAQFDGIIFGGQPEMVGNREFFPIFKADNVALQNVSALHLKQGENVFMLPPLGGREPPQPEEAQDGPQRQVFGLPSYGGLQPYIKIVYNPQATTNKISFEYGMVSLLGGSG